MLDRVLERERIEDTRDAAGLAAKPLVDKDRRDDHRKRVLARTGAMERNPAHIQTDRAGRDGPTLEQYLRHDYERVDISRLGHSELGAGSLAFIIKDGSAVARLYNRQQISYRQYRAAMIYQDLRTKARLDPKLVSDYGQGTGGGSGPGAWLITPSENVASNRQRLRAAQAAIGSQLEIACLEAVVLFDQSFEHVGMKLGNRGRSARRKGGEMVKAGLDRLVGFFGLKDVRED